LVNVETVKTGSKADGPQDLGHRNDAANDVKLRTRKFMLLMLVM
jgi:hypothetical protein